jgi:hypothetical protein
MRVVCCGACAQVVVQTDLLRKAAELAEKLEDTVRVDCVRAGIV